MVVYKVYGATGEYDDYIEWDVKGFVDKRKAEWLCDKLNAVASQYEYKDDWDTKEKIRKKLKLLDDKSQIDYTGTKYSISELDVEGV